MDIPASLVAKQPDPNGPEQSAETTETNNVNSQAEIIIIHTAPNSGSSLYSAYNSKRGKILGSIQIAAGIVSVLAGIAGIVLYFMQPNYYHAASCVIGTGLWCGAFVSIHAKQNKYVCLDGCDYCKV